MNAVSSAADTARRDAETERIRWRRSTACAVLLALAVLLPLLGRKPLADWDEAIYAEVAREFLGRGWLAPHWQFQPWLEKPPLGMWITAVFFRLFGVTAFWARAASALAAAGVTGILHWSAARLRGLATAWMATLVLLSTLGFLRAAHIGELDALLALGCCASLWGLAQVRRGEAGGWYWFWLGFAFAVMVKGAASVTLVLTLAILWIANGWGGRQLNRSFLAGLVLFAVIVVPWHLAMLHAFGGGFLREYLGLHVLARATRPIEGHTTPWWFYGRVLLAYAAPWLLFVPWAYARRAAWQQLREYAVFAAVVLCFFTAVATRSPKYIVPAYPALALLIADALASPLGRLARTRAVALGVALVVAWGASAALTAHLREGLNISRGPNGLPLASSVEAVRLLREALRQTAVPPREPVLLWGEGEAMQTPALLFYGHRPLQQVYLAHVPGTDDEALRYANPQPLDAFVTTTPRLIVAEKPLLRRLPPGMRFTPLASGTTLAAGLIAIDTTGY